MVGNGVLYFFIDMYGHHSVSMQCVVIHSDHMGNMWRYIPTM